MRTITQKERDIAAAVRAALVAKFGEDRVVNGDLRWGRVDTGSTVTYVFLRPKGEKGYFDSESVEIEPAEFRYQDFMPSSFQVRYRINFNKRVTRYPLKGETVAIDKLVARVEVALQEMEKEEENEKLRRAAMKEASNVETAMRSEFVAAGCENLIRELDLARSNGAGGLGVYRGKLRFEGLTLRQIQELLRKVEEMTKANG